MIVVNHNTVNIHKMNFYVMNVLVIAAHPDDEVLGMGGTMLRHAKENDTVNVMYLATGITSRKNDSLVTKNSDYKRIQEKYQNEIKKLRNDALSAAKLLNVEKTTFFDFPDNAMDSVPQIEITKVIEKEIAKNKPDRIYTNHFNDLNVDHRTVFNATMTACRPVNFIVKEIFSFEVLSSTEWNYPLKFNPNYFVNIKNQLSKKISAMKCFKSEIKKFPHPRSPEGIKTSASKWGSVAGFDAAEAFEIIRKIEK